MIASSSSVVTLSPPDSLAIKVEAGGVYAGIQWTRTPIALNVSNGELVDFHQTFMRTVISEEDWGLYIIRLVNSSNWTLASVHVCVTSNSLSVYPTPYVPASASLYGMWVPICDGACIKSLCVHYSVSVDHENA